MPKVKRAPWHPANIEHVPGTTFHGEFGNFSPWLCVKVSPFARVEGESERERERERECVLKLLLWHKEGTSLPSPRYQKHRDSVKGISLSVTSLKLKAFNFNASAGISNPPPPLPSVGVSFLTEYSDQLIKSL